MADSNDSPREFFRALPHEEQQCLVQALSQASVDEILDGAEPSQEANQVLDQCVSQETFARVLMGSFVSSVGGLSDDTLGCMWEILGEASTGGGDFPVDFVAFLRLALCLSDEEAARAEPGAGPFEFPLAGVRCVAQQLDMEGLAAMSGDELQELPPDLMAALVECGIEVGPTGEVPQFTPEQVACLRDALGDETLGDLMGRERLPTFEETAALEGCGIDIGEAPVPSPKPIPTPIPTAAASQEGVPKIKQYSQPPEMTIQVDNQYVATINTNKGAITVELFAKEAPKTVNNFVFLSRDGCYDGVIFHRVIPGFMIQGGDPTGTGGGGPGYNFEDEIVTSLVFDAAGLLAMANRGGGTSTNGSQFFITVVPTPHLNGNHTIFGRVIQGQDVADAIAVVPAGPRDKPLQDVVIQGVEIQES